MKACSGRPEHVEIQSARSSETATRRCKSMNGGRLNSFAPLKTLGLDRKAVFRGRASIVFHSESLLGSTSTSFRPMRTSEARDTRNRYPAGDDELEGRLSPFIFFCGDRDRPWEEGATAPPSPSSSTSLSHVRDFPTGGIEIGGGRTRRRFDSGDKENGGVRNTEPLSRRGSTPEAPEKFHRHRHEGD